MRKLPLESMCSVVFSLFFTQASDHKLSLHVATRCTSTDAQKSQKNSSVLYFGLSNESSQAGGIDTLELFCEVVRVRS